jgi:hypothetical protein
VHGCAAGELLICASHLPLLPLHENVWVLSFPSVLLISPCFPCMQASQIDTRCERTLMRIPALDQCAFQDLSQPPFPSFLFFQIGTVP